MKVSAGRNRPGARLPDTSQDTRSHRRYEANFALRLRFASNRAERRGAAREARRVTAAAVRRERLARRLYGAATVAAVEAVERAEGLDRPQPPQVEQVLDLVVPLQDTAPEWRPAELPDTPPPLTDPDFASLVTAPRPGPLAGVTGIG